jgi:hypothetical protein
VDYNHFLNEVKESLDECLESLDECFEMSGDLFGQVATKFSSSNAPRLPSQKTLLDRLLPWRKE